MSRQAPRVALHALGCRVNQAEKDALAEVFRRRGYQVVAPDERADVYVIHTCTVTNLGDRKSRQAIRRVRRQNPEAVVAVSGCYAQTSPHEVLAIPGVDVVVGSSGRLRLPDLVEEARREKRPLNAVGDIWRERDFEELPVAPSGHTRAFLKIQEGCRYFCSYCIVPYARGRLRSREPTAIIAAVRDLVETGYREVVLTGTCTGSWGVDLPGSWNLARLLPELVRIPGLERLRFGSLDPEDFSHELVAAMASSPVVCPHLHLPLQSGSPSLLARMRRRYSVADYLDLVSRLRAARPGLAISSDILVGFPGEREEDHRQSLAVAEQVGFMSLHVFKYSPRRGTPAAEMPGQVDSRVKERRSHDFRALGEHLFRRFASSFLLHQVVPVLLEEEVAAGHWQGLTPTYVRVIVAAQGNLAGQVMPVKIEELGNGWVGGYLAP